MEKGEEEDVAMPNDTAALPPVPEPPSQRAWRPLDRGEARPGRDPRGEDGGGGGGGGGGAGGGGGGDAPSRNVADGPGAAAHDAFTFGGGAADAGEADTRFAGGPNAGDVLASGTGYDAAAGTLDNAMLDELVEGPDSIASGPFPAVSGTAELL